MSSRGDWKRLAIYTGDSGGNIIAEVRHNSHTRQFIVTRRDFSPVPQPLPEIGERILLGHSYKTITAIHTQPDGTQVFGYSDET